MTQTKEAVAATLGYDSRTQQTIPFTVEKNGTKFPLSHTLDPLSNDRYFQLEDEFEKIVKKLTRVSVALYDPKILLWKELAVSRGGYKEREDWKEHTHPNDCTAVINALLNTTIADEKTEDADGVLYDDEALTEIKFWAAHSGGLHEITHRFREETKKEMDEFLSIQTDDTSRTELASAAKVCKAERLYRLGQGLLKEHDGYAEGSDIPAWHLAATTESFFSRQFARMGKS
jgi:hypothetical protein